MGVISAKIALQISAQVSAIHITPREQAALARLPGSTTLNSAISIIGPINVSVFSNNSKNVVAPVSKARIRRTPSPQDESGS